MSPIYLERTHRLKTTPRHAVPTTDVRALRRQGRVVAGWAARGVQGGAASTGRAAAALGEIGGAGCSGAAPLHRNSDRLFLVPNFDRPKVMCSLSSNN